MTPEVRRILAAYEGTPPGVKAALARILMHGRLGGTGKVVILPIDQGFEHGPARSFAGNPDGYDPHYHYSLAVEAGLNAFAAPLGLLEAGADSFAGRIPTILKLNSSNSWATEANQSLTGSVADAVRIGCVAVGFTLYPGSEHAFSLIERLRAVREEAQAAGLATVVWSYPRGGRLTKEGETALDVVAYAAHMAALLGAHIIKVKLPTSHVEQDEAQAAYAGRDWSNQVDRVRHVVEAVFAGRRIVVFSGGAEKDLPSLYQDARDIRDGGGNGSIVGRNTFQRPRKEALTMLQRMIRIYEGE